MRVGIYGGSFNPVHYGHLNVARQALAELSLDRLIVIPAAVSPFKTEKGDPVFPDRLAMVKNAFAGLDKTVVDERELKRGGVSYAIDTVKEIRAELSVSASSLELYFIIGEDSVEGLPRWKDADTLWRLCTPKAFPRTPESSTEIRARLAKGEPIADLVPSVVDLFIRHRVRYTDDAKIAGVVLDGLRRKAGYCPCRLPKNPEFFCPCEEFRGQLADPAFHGLCHCRLYLKP